MRLLQQTNPSTPHQARFRSHRMLPKPMYLALLGGLGCVLGALAGELLLVATRVGTTTDPRLQERTICLLVDCSSSMSGQKLPEVRDAAIMFVREQDWSMATAAVVQFDSSAHVLARATSDPATLEQGLATMSDGGSTAMDEGMFMAGEAVAGGTGSRHVLLFTDGVPDSDAAALQVAQALRDDGIQIVAIGTGDADTGFLAKVTGDHELVLWATNGQIAEAFIEAHRLIANASLVDASSRMPIAVTVCRVGGWTALLAIGGALGMIVGQNRMMCRRLLSRRGLLLGGVGGLVAGFLAGSMSQALFWIVRTEMVADVSDAVVFGSILTTALTLPGGANPPKRIAAMIGLGAALGLAIALVLHSWFRIGTWSYAIVSAPVWAVAGGMIAMTIAHPRHGVSRLRGGKVGLAVGGVGIILLFGLESFGVNVARLLTDTSTRITGWAMLGTTMGGGMAMVIPNLDWRRAMIAGGIGGALSAVVLLSAGAHIGDFAGRLAGAASLGGMIGLTAGLVEVVFRQNSLEITAPDGQWRLVNLGSRPVRVGGEDRGSDVPLSGGTTAFYDYRVENGHVICEDGATRRARRVMPGESYQVDGTRITLHGD